MILLDKIIPLLALWSTLNNRNVTWNQLEYGIWAEDCSFDETLPLNRPWKSLANIKNVFKCYQKCVEYDRCTHFIYENSQKNCILSTGDIQKAISSNSNSCGILALDQLQWSQSYELKYADGCKLKNHTKSFVANSLELCGQYCYIDENCASFNYDLEMKICYFLDFKHSRELIARDPDGYNSCGINKFLKWRKDNYGYQAYGCYFNSTAFEVKVLGSSSDCYESCYNTPDCTHANWINESKCELNSGMVTIRHAITVDELSNDCLVINSLDWYTAEDSFTSNNCHFPNTKILMIVPNAYMSRCHQKCLEIENCTHLELDFTHSYIGNCVLKSGEVEKSDAIRSKRVDTCRIIRKLQWNNEMNGAWAYGCQFKASYYSTLTEKERIESHDTCRTLCIRNEECISYFWDKPKHICSILETSYKIIDPSDNVLLTENEITCGFIQRIHWEKSGLNEYAQGCTFSNSIVIANFTGFYSEYGCMLQCKEFENCSHYEYLSNNNNCILKNGNETKSEAVISNKTNYCGIMEKIAWKNVNGVFLAEHCSFKMKVFEMLMTNDSSQCYELCAEAQYCAFFHWNRIFKFCYLNHGSVTENDATSNEHTDCGFFTKKTKLNWDFNFHGAWAKGCQYASDNSSKEVLNISDNCSLKCVETDGCTHYNWFDEIKMCELLFNSNSTEKVYLSNYTSQCGQIKNRWNEINGGWWSSDCNFIDGIGKIINHKNTQDIIECHTWCQETQGCTSFLFNSFQKCFLRSGAINQSIFKFASGTKCGWLQEKVIQPKSFIENY